MDASEPKNEASRKVVQWLEQSLRRERESVASQLERRHQDLILDLSRQLSFVAAGTTDVKTSGGTSKEEAVTEQSIGAGLGGDDALLVEHEEVAEVDAALATDSAETGKKLKKFGKGGTGSSVSKPVFASQQQALDGASLYQKYAYMVNSNTFESVIAVVIVFSAIIMAFEMQYRGIETGYKVAYPSYSTPADDLWPWAVDVFQIAEWIFGILFTVELFMKLTAQRRQFFIEFWNWIDVLIVGSWLATVIWESDSNFNPNILRLLRLMRLLRDRRAHCWLLACHRDLGKRFQLQPEHPSFVAPDAVAPIAALLGMISAFDSLYLMTTAIKGSLHILIWAVLVLLVVEMSVACLLQASVENFLRDGTASPERKMEVYMYFGSFARSMLTMFELTLGNWMPPTRACVENVSEWYLLFFLLHKFIIGFSVVSVLTGVFIQETFKVATSDDQIMLNNKRRAMKEHTTKMTNLFKYADTDGDGSLDRAEFDKVMDDPIVRKWLSSMGLEIDDVDTLFDTLNGGDSKVTAQELVVGAGRLKGNARSIDLLTFITEYRQDRGVIMEQLDQLQRCSATETAAV
eukprot:CAMPEP_0172780718 /NCGR_PEP_ID=MMETSP1074-20121228/203070_1 /TAXON_ID=2916 /ORGANISM="Ceratium fusus, Strain PA161109" /LENGTH=574 /DNA_ID=CAMNT_0013617695 /DNA_START=58 /DNA_END=1783 /DNA_ORIENTATION=-